MKIRELSLAPSANHPQGAILTVRFVGGEFSIDLPTNSPADADGVIDIEAAVLQNGLGAVISSLGAWAGA